VSVHNFANNNSPGLFQEDRQGNHIFFTNTQEEQLLRSSLIDGKIYLPLDMYPICADDRSSSGLLTKDVSFTKDRKKGLELPKDEQYIADVITCPAIDLPEITNEPEYETSVRPSSAYRFHLKSYRQDEEDLIQPPSTSQYGFKSYRYVNKEDEETTLKRMILVINMAKDSDIFITGLWGCGAFCHPIKEVIRLWKKAINMSTNLPKEIMFCYYLDIFTNITDGDEKSVKIMEGLL
jgi:hypothetical protein